MRNNLWIIEARRPDGTLDLSGLQPETIFGTAAITGITDDAIAKAIYRTHPDAVLRGDAIARWPALIDPRFIARQKTW